MAVNTRRLPNRRGENSRPQRSSSAENVMDGACKQRGNFKGIWTQKGKFPYNQMKTSEISEANKGGRNLEKFDTQRSDYRQKNVKQLT